MCASITCCLGGRSDCAMFFGMLSDSSKLCMSSLITRCVPQLNYIIQKGIKV